MRPRAYQRLPQDDDDNGEDLRHFPPASEHLSPFSSPPTTPTSVSVRAKSALRSLLSPMTRSFLSASRSEAHIPPEDDSLEQWTRANSKHLPGDPRYNQGSWPRRFCTSKYAILACILTTIAAIALTAFILRTNLRMARLRMLGIPPGLYSRDGHLYVGRDTRFHIKGFSWYGLEEPAHALGGMHRTSADKILDFAAMHRFNAIRLPLSVENILGNRRGVTDTTVFHNPELAALSYLDAIEFIVRMAADRNILILLDIHRLASKEVQSAGLWYSTEYPQVKVEDVWRQLCDRLGAEWNIMGADIYNEPWDATWNDSNVARDWKIASEKMGGIIHERCPSWLLLVEGVGERAGVVKTNPFWAENLRVMHDNPPEFTLRNKAALSPHVYGPSVHNQSYFASNDFTGDMPAIWDDHFGEANQATGFATIIGEWGGKFQGVDADWQRKFFSYLQRKEFGFFYWCLNPESADTFGLVQDDWKTPVMEKLDLLGPAISSQVENHIEHFTYFQNWRT